MNKQPRKSDGATFRFRRGMDVGSIEAETDGKFLEKAFLDAGYLDVLRDTANPRSIVVGRTGVGKSALLLQMQRTPGRVIRIRPESLSLHYISNSTMLPQLADMGVHLELFYKLLWRHVFVVELLGSHYDIRSPEVQDDFLSRIVPSWIRNRGRKKRAVSYIQTWGKTFWQDTEERVKELIRHLETELQSELGFDFAPLKGSTGGREKNEVTVTSEIITRAQNVISKIQISDLDHALEMIREEVLADEYKPYYVLVDDLDKAWVDRRFAYDLIAALLQEAGEFARLPNVKIVVALREDIVEAMLIPGRRARGQQREKIESLFLRPVWTEQELIEMMDARISELFRGPHGQSLTLEAVLPTSKNASRKTGVEYILERTALRPRDVIRFVNLCIAKAAPTGTISWETITQAEETYSRESLRALIDEWADTFPGIEVLFSAFEHMDDDFVLADIKPARLECIWAAAESSTNEASEPNIFYQIALKASVEDAAAEIVRRLYRVGFFGVKLTPEHEVRYSYQDRDLLENGLRPESRVFFHPSLYDALGVGKPARQGRRR